MGSTDALSGALREFQIRSPLQRSKFRIANLSYALPERMVKAVCQVSAAFLALLGKLCNLVLNSSNACCYSELAVLKISLLEAGLGNRLT